MTPIIYDTNYYTKLEIDGENWIIDKPLADVLQERDARIAELEAERNAIADIISAAGVDGGLLQWRVKTLVSQRRELARALVERYTYADTMKLARSILEEADDDQE